MIRVLALALPFMSCTCRDEEDTGQDESPSPPIASLGQADVVVDGGADYSNLAITMGHAGAVNGETQGILLGARPRSEHVFWAKMSTIFFLDSFHGAQNVSVADSTAVLLEGEDPDGMSHTEIGDQNGDGFSEIAVELDCEVFLLFGPVSGSVGLSDASVVLSKEKGYDDGYFQVESAGDVDGDGVDDLFIGDLDTEDPVMPSTAYLFYGPTTSSMPLSSADVVIEEPDSTSIGREVARLGDISGDGHDDVLIRASRSYGPSQAVFLGPLDASDSYETADAYLELSTYSSDNYDMDGDSDRLFHSAGDVDNDGCDDVLIGLPSFSTTSSSGLENESAGGAYVLFGPLSGIITEDDVDVFVTSSESKRQVGFDAAGLGDVNADGFDDILLGAPDFWMDVDTYGPNYFYGSGGAYLLLGPLGAGRDDDESG